MIEDLIQIKRKFLFESEPLLAKSIADLLSIQKAKEALFSEHGVAAGHSVGPSAKYGQLKSIQLQNDAADAQLLTMYRDLQVQVNLIGTHEFEESIVK